MTADAPERFGLQPGALLDEILGLFAVLLDTGTSRDRFFGGHTSSFHMAPVVRTGRLERVSSCVDVSTTSSQVGTALPADWKLPENADGNLPQNGLSRHPVCVAGHSFRLQ
jgi:hypothetical protein